MKRERTAIEIGQIWRDKRDHARVIRVTNLFVGQAPGGGKPAIRVEYELTSGKARKNARPVAESCFRGDYELVKACQFTEGLKLVVRIRALKDAQSAARKQGSKR